MPSVWTGGSRVTHPVWGPCWEVIRLVLLQADATVRTVRLSPLRPLLLLPVVDNPATALVVFSFVETAASPQRLGLSSIVRCRAGVTVAPLLRARGEMSGNCSASQRTTHACPLLAEAASGSQGRVADPTKAPVLMVVVLLLLLVCGGVWRGRPKEEGSAGIHGAAAGVARAEGVKRQSICSRVPCAR